MININLSIGKKLKNQIIPQTNNFFLQNTHLSHKKKSPPKQLNSFRDLTKQDFIEVDQDEKQLLLTDRGKKKSNKEEYQKHKRTSSTTKKSTIHQTSTRHPTPSTGVSTKVHHSNNFKQKDFLLNNNSQLGHQTNIKQIMFQGNFQKNKHEIKTNKKQYNPNPKDSFNSKHPPPVSKNISDIVVRMPKKKLVLANNSSLGDQQRLKASLPGWSGQKVIQKFGLMLTQYQKQQLTNEKQVYYIGVGTGVGQDDTDGAYLWKTHQQIGFRYELLQPLGSGAFGQVIRAFDHKNKQHVAIKIIRSKKQHMQLALNQINILMKAKQKDIQNEKNILRIKDFIVFRKHICIITQVLSISLYELLESNNFASLQMTYIRTFAIQILNALAFLKQIKIVHSDLKPENVMLKNKTKTGIKIIDFGTSMFSNQTNFLYIQSRFYRAPQVILGAPYGYEIDMWSFGCLLAELYLGQPLFAGRDQAEQLALIMESVELHENQDFLKKCKNIGQYFNSQNEPKPYKDSEGRLVRPNTRQLFLFIQDKSFCQYLSKILTIDPKQRYTPLEALLDPWIIQGLPQQIKHQHLSFIKSKMKQQKKRIQKDKKQYDHKQQQLKRLSKNQGTQKKGHRRQNTSQLIKGGTSSKKQQKQKQNYKQSNKKQRSKEKQRSKQRQRQIQYQPQSTIKKSSRNHSRRNSDFKYQEFNAKAAHLKHKRRGSAGIF